MKIIVL